mmetsp:Transcript_117779/g.345019  ORF Transcript_117779/g.345019 Transcript_117779/m.345019 type:complete len:203 (-) Transcript_117779:260-868(-)
MRLQGRLLLILLCSLLTSAVPRAAGEPAAGLALDDECADEGCALSALQLRGARLDGQGMAGAWNATGCSDDNPQCPGWAKAGECQSTPDWMFQNCKLSCSVCGPSLPMREPEPDPEPEPTPTTTWLRPPKLFYDCMQDGNAKSMLLCDKKCHSYCAPRFAPMDCKCNVNSFGRYFIICTKQQGRPIPAQFCNPHTCLCKSSW